MLEPLLKEEDDLMPDVSNLVTEDDTPVDNLPSEKHQRLLTTVLYTNKPGEKFIAAANVGIYHTYKQPAIVPDVFVSLNVEVAESWWEKPHRCYLMWLFGKPPEVVIEIVSNQEGGELDKKFQIYEQMRVSYYVVYDPSHQLSEKVLRIFELRGLRYFETEVTWLEQVQLGLRLWEGEFENKVDTWLRWCDQEGNILPTGDEKALNAEERAQTAEQRAQTAEQRAQILAEQLRALGVTPESI